MRVGTVVSDAIAIVNHHNIVYFGVTFVYVGQVGEHIVNFQEAASTVLVLGHFAMTLGRFVGERIGRDVRDSIVVEFGLLHLHLVVVDRTFVCFVTFCISSFHCVMYPF